MKSLKAVPVPPVLLSVRLTPLLHGRQNNIGLLRIVAAAVVLLFHSYALNLRFQDEPLARVLPGHDFGSLGVGLFFFISGLLVTRSFVGNPSLRMFGVARALRIYPALIVAVLFSAGIASVSSSLPALEFLRSPALVAFMWRAMAGLPAFDQMPAFTTNPIPYAINGSLWTLPIELRLYCLVAVLGVIGAFRKRRWFCAALVVIAAWLVLMPASLTWNMGLMPVLPLALLFALGMASTICASAIVLSIPLATFTIALLALWPTASESVAIYCPIVAYVTLVLAYHPALRLPDLFRNHDYSYGLYVYAFPIQQSLIYFGGPAMRSPPALFAASVMLCVPVAVLSWHYIERRALALKAPIQGALSTSASDPEALRGRRALRAVGQYASTAFLVLMVAVATLDGFSRPLKNWDIVGYVGAAISTVESDRQTLFDQTAHDLLEGVGPLRTHEIFESRVLVDPESFRQQLPFYAVKPAYIWLIYTVGTFTDSFSAATWQISAVSFVALCIVLAAWRPPIDRALWLALLALLIALGERSFAVLSQYSTPDALATAASMGALYGLLERRNVLAFTLLGIIAVLARPDAMLLIVAVPVVLSVNRDPTFGVRGIALLASAGVLAAVAVLVNRLADGYGWKKLFYQTFVEQQPWPADTTIHLPARLYFQVLGRQLAEVWTEVHLIPLVALSAVAVAVAVRKGLRDSLWLGVMFAAWLALAARFAMFPFALDARSVFAYYLLILIAGISLLGLAYRDRRGLRVSELSAPLPQSPWPSPLRTDKPNSPLIISSGPSEDGTGAKASYQEQITSAAKRAAMRASRKRS